MSALAPSSSPLQIVLRVIGAIGVGGGTGYVIEYRGSAIRALSMEERMTVCNMSIEAGARAGMIAPDDTTYQYLNGRSLAPKGAAWDAAVSRWRSLPSDDAARFDKQVDIDVSALRPMVTFGTNPGMVISIDDAVPRDDDPTFRKALAYMQVEAGKPLLGKPVDVVFIGSCTNGRLSDLRQAAGILRGRRVADRVRLLVVPGSQEVKRQAAEALAALDAFDEMVEGFVRSEGIRTDRFGMMAANRPDLVHQMRRGRDFRRSTMRRVFEYMAGADDEG